jgi:hypothetical protein
VQGARHKFLAGFQTLDEHIQLIRQSLTLCTTLIGLACDARHHISGEIRDSDWRKDFAQPDDEIGFNSLYSNVVDEALERDLIAKIAC